MKPRQDHPCFPTINNDPTRTSLKLLFRILGVPNNKKSFRHPPKNSHKRRQWISDGPHRMLTILPGRRRLVWTTTMLGLLLFLQVPSSSSSVFLATAALTTTTSSTSGCGLCASTGDCHQAFQGQPGQYCGTFYSQIQKTAKPCCCPARPNAICQLGSNSCMCHVTTTTNINSSSSSSSSGGGKDSSSSRTICTVGRMYSIVVD